MRFLAHLRRNLLWLLLTTYVLAALCPRPGLAVRNFRLCTLRFGGEHAVFGGHALILAVLLFISALDIDPSQLRSLGRQPRLVAGSIFAVLGLPLGVAMLVAFLVHLSPWRGDLFPLTVGLGMVAAMPVAASSPGWSQSSHGNTAMSLGLVLVSTILSPWLAPRALTLIAPTLVGSRAAEMSALGGAGTPLFMLGVVVLPLCAGAAVGPALRGRRVRDGCKVLSLVCLLTLNYVSGCLALPALSGAPQWRFLAHALPAVGVHCALSFLTARWVATALGAKERERIAAMFGTGMRNTGAAMVLASSALAAEPRAIFVIVACGTAQELAAGLIARHRLSPGTKLTTHFFDPRQHLQPET